MAKASLVAVKTANLMQVQADQNDRIEQKLDQVLALLGGNKPAKDAPVPLNSYPLDEPAKVAAPKRPKPAKVAALK